jgi:hypothetical protein
MGHTQFARGTHTAPAADSRTGVAVVDKGKAVAAGTAGHVGAPGSRGRCPHISSAVANRRTRTGGTAAGGVLVVDSRHDHRDHQRLVTSASKLGKAPEGMRLVERHRAGQHEIRLERLPDWLTAALTPVRVPKALRPASPWLAELRRPDGPLPVKGSPVPELLPDPGLERSRETARLSRREQHLGRSSRLPEAQQRTHRPVHNRGGRPDGRRRHVAGGRQDEHEPTSTEAGFARTDDADTCLGAEHHPHRSDETPNFVFRFSALKPA